MRRPCSTSERHDPRPGFLYRPGLGQEISRHPGEAGLTVERHADHFAADCPDEDWLTEVGSKRWIAITHDQRIRYKPNELAAVIDNRVALLVVIGQAPYPELAQAFVATYPRIESFIQKHQAPYIAKVYRSPASDPGKDSGTSGRVELWYPKR